MTKNIKNKSKKPFWILFLFTMLMPYLIYSQIPGYQRVNKKYEVWQINRINYNWPKRKRDFRPQLFYLFFRKYKKRNHNNWRQYVPIETVSNHVIRPQVETFRDTMSGLLKTRTIQYAFQKISVGWYLHYQKQILDKRKQLTKEIDALSNQGSIRIMIENEFHQINQTVDGIRNALMDDIEKQKGFAQAIVQYDQLLHTVQACQILEDIKNEKNDWIHQKPIQVYVQSSETYGQAIESIIW